MGDLPGRISYIIAVVIGFPGSFVVGPAVFADGGPVLSPERLVPIIASYIFLGAIAGLVCRFIYSTDLWWPWGTVVSIPAFLSILLFGSDIGVGFQLLYFVMSWAFACLGVYAGMRFAVRLKGKRG